MYSASIKKKKTKQWNNKIKVKQKKNESVIKDLIKNWWVTQIDFGRCLLHVGDVPDIVLIFDH